MITFILLPETYQELLYFLCGLWSNTSTMHNPSSVIILYTSFLENNVTTIPRS